MLDLISARLRELGMSEQKASVLVFGKAMGVQNRKAGSDAMMTGVGVFLFWPALLFAGGDDASASAVARLKGEMQAIEFASNRNGCNIKFAKSK